MHTACVCVFVCVRAHMCVYECVQSSIILPRTNTGIQPVTMWSLWGVQSQQVKAHVIES